MNGIRRGLVALFGVLGMLGPVGCSAPRTANVTIFNSSTSDLRVNAWVAGEVDPAQADAKWDAAARVVPPGGDTTFALNRPEPSKEPGIVVRVVPIGFDEDQPYWIQLQPPGPFFLRVRGSGGDLTMSRDNIQYDESAGRGPGGIPDAPGERRYRGSLPPWVAR
ncbi:MAG: hypothetical protein Kow0022_11960 [Phycisphaerales bacterium]